MRLSPAYTPSGTYTLKELTALADSLEPSLILKAPGYDPYWRPMKHDRLAVLQCRDERRRHDLAFLLAVIIIYCRTPYLPKPLFHRTPPEVQGIRLRLAPGATRRTGENQCNQCLAQGAYDGWLGCWSRGEECAACAAREGTCSFTTTTGIKKACGSRRALVEVGSDGEIEPDENASPHAPHRDSHLDFDRSCTQSSDGEIEFLGESRTVFEPAAGSRAALDLEKQLTGDKSANGADARENEIVPPPPIANEPMVDANSPEEVADNSRHAIHAIVVHWSHIHTMLDHTLRLNDATMASELRLRAAALEAAIDTFTNAAAPGAPQPKHVLDFVRAWGGVYYPLDTVIALNDYQSVSTKRLLEQATKVLALVGDIATAHGLSDILRDALLPSK